MTPPNITETDLQKADAVISIMQNDWSDATIKMAAALAQERLATLNLPEVEALVDALYRVRSFASGEPNYIKDALSNFAKPKEGLGE